MADSSAASAIAANGRKAPPTIVFRIDHTAFTRGHTVPGEICEIVGIGPVPVSVVQRLANDAIFKALITDGTDIRSISHLSRVIPVRLRTGVEELQPECVIGGCHVSRHLEIDHNIPVEEQGPTALWNLNRLCHHHHRVKTTQKMRLAGEGLNKHLIAGPRPPPDP